jgi:membrane protease YdiL (CAAX protease family)
MESPQVVPNDWSDYADIVVLLILWTYFLIRDQRTVSHDEFFSHQRWGLGEVLVFIAILRAMEMFVLHPLGALISDPKLHGLIRLGVWVAVSLYGLVGVGVFFFYIRQPLYVVGISSKQSIPLILLGIQFVSCFLTLLWLVASVMTPDDASRRFSTYGDLNYNSWSNQSEALVSAGLFFVQSFWQSGVTSIAEEIGYVGLLYGALRRHVTYLPAILITATCFMAAHGSFHLSAFLLGLAGTWFLEKYHSLVPAIVIHFCFDLSRHTDGWFLGVLKVPSTTYFQTAAMIVGLAAVTAFGILSYIGKGKKDIQGS